MSKLPPHVLKRAGLLAACALVLASGLNYGIGQWLSGGDEATESAEAESEEAAEKKSPARAKTSRKPDKRSYLDPILRRNIFDPDASPAEAAEDTPDSDRATDLDLVLLATIVAVPESYSSALIAEGKRGGEAGGYGIGDTLLNEAEIIGIEQKRILLRRSNNEVEYLAIEEEKTTTRRSSRKKDDEEEGDGRVRQDGENKWIVDRELVDEQLSNVDKLASQLRVRAHKGPDGEIDGYRLSGIRRGSLFDQLGIRNGDIVHGVNGTPLTSADGAYSAYQALKDSSSFNFDLTRRNQKQNFEYEIR